MALSCSTTFYARIRLDLLIFAEKIDVQEQCPEQMYIVSNNQLPAMLSHVVSVHLFEEVVFVG